MPEQPTQAPAQYAVIATPAYDGTVHDLCASSVAEARFTCIQAGIWTAWLILSGSAYLPIARNKLVRDFLAIEGATDLVFVDADIGFDPAALPRLLQHDADVVGGAYRFKGDVEKYPMMVDWAEAGTPKIDAATGLPECVMLPTGLLRIRRTVFDRFLAYYGAEALQIIERDGETGEERERYHNYFDTRQIGEQFFGEDVFFCKMWREMGGKIVLDPDIDITHSGRKHFPGNYQRYRERMPGGRLHGMTGEQEADVLRGKLTRVGEGLKQAAADAEAILEPMDELARLAAGGAEGVPPSQQGGMRQDADETERIAREVPTAVVPRVEIMGGAGPEAGEYRELLLGCGSAKEKRMTRDGHPANGEAWRNVTTLDVNADHKPDMVFDLNQRYWPFDSDSFDEVHAYEVLEHLGTQGDYRTLFEHFTEIWRILKPGGVLCATVPHWQSLWAWGDPSHTRVINEGTLSFLDQAIYREQVGRTVMSDFRFCYDADLVLKHSTRAGDHFVFVLEAVKPSRWSAP